jgi:hypothetical protein
VYAASRNSLMPVDSIDAHTSNNSLTPIDSIDAHTPTSPISPSPPTSSPPASPSPPVRPLRKQSSSSSSEGYHILSLTMNMSSTGTIAVLSLNNGKCPMISAGAMTPELLHRFEHHACGYLQNKDGLNAKNFVNHIVYSFEDPLFSDWYQSQQELLSPSLLWSSCARSMHAGCLNDGNRASHGRFARRNRIRPCSQSSSMPYAVTTSY